MIKEKASHLRGAFFRLLRSEQIQKELPESPDSPLHLSLFLLIALLLLREYHLLLALELQL